MARYSSPASVSYSFGPGPVSTAIKALILTNVAMFLASMFVPGLLVYLGLRPAAVIEQYHLWQPITYMFLHGGIFHLLFNMLALWMFGAELERLWGVPLFVKYYFLTGLGAAATTLLLSFTPFAFAEQMYVSVTIGASGAIYGLLLAYALHFPDRPIYMYLLFPIRAKYFVLIVGAIAFLSSIGDGRGGIAHAAHLGGLVAGYLFLKGGRMRPIAEIKYRYLKWKINRLKRKFDVYSGGRAGGRADDWDRRVH